MEQKDIFSPVLFKLTRDTLKQVCAPFAAQQASLLAQIKQAFSVGEKDSGTELCSDLVSLEFQNAINMEALTALDEIMPQAELFQKQRVKIASEVATPITTLCFLSIRSSVPRLQLLAGAICSHMFLSGIASMFMNDSLSKNARARGFSLRDDVAARFGSRYSHEEALVQRISLINPYVKLTHALNSPISPGAAQVTQDKSRTIGGLLNSILSLNGVVRDFRSAHMARSRSSELQSENPDRPYSSTSQDSPSSASPAPEGTLKHTTSLFSLHSKIQSALFFDATDRNQSIGVTASSKTEPGSMQQGRAKSFYMTAPASGSRPGNFFLGPSAMTQDAISITPDKMTFGLGSGQAPVDSEIKEVITVSNRFGRDLFLTLRNVCEPHVMEMCSIRFEPDFSKEVPLDRNKSIDVAIYLKVMCTCKISLMIAVEARKPRSEERTVRIIEGAIQSELSYWLDPDEIEIGPEIGRGGYGTAYKAKYRSQVVAAKFFNTTEMAGIDPVQDFNDEVSNLARFSRHSNIVAFVGAVRIPKRLAILTKFCKYGSLLSAMNKYPDVFNLRMRLKVLCDISSAMSFLHDSGVIHRDLKPDNVLIYALTPDADVCKLSDFGTTRSVNTLVHQKIQSQILTTPTYVAPEMFRNRVMDKPCDVYAFALLMWSTFTGKEPFTGSSFEGADFNFSNAIMDGLRPPIPESMPPELQALMVACWDDAPEKRPVFSDIHRILRKFYLTLEAEEEGF